MPSPTERGGRRHYVFRLSLHPSVHLSVTQIYVMCKGDLYWGYIKETFTGVIFCYIVLCFIYLILLYINDFKLTLINLVKHCEYRIISEGC